MKIGIVLGPPDISLELIVDSDEIVIQVVYEICETILDRLPTEWITSIGATTS